MLSFAYDFSNSFFTPRIKKEEISQRYLQINAYDICQELRKSIPQVIEEKDKYVKDTVFEGKGEKIIVFGNYTYYQVDPNVPWKWESGFSKFKKNRNRSNLVLNPSLQSLQIPLQKYIHQIVNSIQETKHDLNFELPQEGTRIGVENRLCLVESDCGKPQKISWHVDSGGFIPNDCWSVVTHYSLPPSLFGGDLKFRGFTYEPRENHAIVFEKDLEHKVTPVYSVEGISLRGSLQLFFST